MLICFATFTNAQNNNDKQWKEVTKLEEKGLTKSALELVDEIYNSAVKDGLSQERIKALLYKSKYMLILEEEAQLNIINLFKQEIESRYKTGFGITDNNLQASRSDNMLRYIFLIVSLLCHSNTVVCEIKAYFTYMYK